MTHHHDHGHAAPDMAHDMLRRFVGAAILTVPIVLYSSLGTSLVGRELAPPFGLSHGLLGFVLTSVVVWWGGWPFVSSAWRSLLRGELTMMTLIATGILVSYGYSVAVTFGLRGELFYDAAAMLTAFSVLGHWLEMRSRFATGRAVEALLELAPPTARRVRDGAEQEVPLEAVVVGDMLAVRPGDTVPVDGVVTDGSSYVDESMLTGEPIPVGKQPDAAVTGGTRNQQGAFRFRATKVGADTALAKIVALVREAQSSKAPAQRLADVAGKYLVIVALADVVPDAGVDEAEVLRLAAAADAQSEHPLAAALVAGAAARAIPVATAHGFEAIPGYGVRASLDGRSVLVGNRKLLERERVAPRLAERAEQLRSEGKTVLYVAAQGRLLGLLAVADRIRPGAPAAVARLHGLGVRVVLLTGDSRVTAEAVARSLGIADVRAEVLPGDKATEVRRLEAGGAHVAMVGDGVNDAPALAAASVGIAIGAGTDVAIETAGVVLMRDDPADVATALTLARRVRRKIKQNLFWAAIYNAIAIPVAAGALYPSLGILLQPAWAALAMSASTVTVTVNALLLGPVDTSR